MNHQPTVRVMGVTEFREDRLGSLFCPDERRAYCRAERFPDMPRGWRACQVALADDVARFHPGVVCWLFGSWLPLALLVLASGSRRRIRKGGGWVWCVCGAVWCAGTQSRAVVLSAWRHLRERGEGDGDGGGVEWEMGEACGLQTRIISAGARLAGSAGKAGRRHFALGLFAPHLQFRNRFLTLPSFCRYRLL